MNARDVAKMITKMIEPHVRSARLMVGRVVADLVNDATGIQTVQCSVLAGEIRELERMQDYGFTSVPFSQSAEGVAVFVGGNREHGIIVKLDDRTFRKKGLTPGQVSVYDASLSYLLLKNDTKVDLQGLEVAIGNVLPGVTEKILKGETFQSFFNAHVHISSAPGNATSPPTSPSLPTDLSLSAKVGI